MRGRYAITGNRIAALLLTVLLTALCAPAALAQEEAAELENGITWDTTFDQMLEIEGVAETELRTVEKNGFVKHSLQKSLDDGAKEYIVYLFKEDQLAQYHKYPNLNDKSADLFAEYLTQYKEKQGDPTLDDKERFVALFNTTSGNIVNADYFVEYAGWDLGNGIELYLVMTSDGYTAYLYFNTPLFPEASESGE